MDKETQHVLTDFHVFGNNVAKKLEGEEVETDCSKTTLNRHLVKICASLGAAAEKEHSLPDYGQFSDDMGRGFDTAYTYHLLDSAFDYLAEAAIQIFCIFAKRGIEIAGFDNEILNYAPKGFSISDDFHSWIYDLIACVTHRNVEEQQILDCLLLYKQNPDDAELKAIIEEKFGSEEDDETQILKTEEGYENFIIQRHLLPVLNSIASWFKRVESKGMVWHINARLYYLSHFDK